MSAGYRVLRTPGIGTVGVRVSEPRNSRRTLKNIGQTTLEIVETEGGAYGTGYPLDPGASFTFDAAGDMNGPIYVASSAAGGLCVVMGY